MDTSMSQSDPLRDLFAALRQVLTAHPEPAPATPSTTSVNTITTPSTLLCASPMAKTAPYSGLAEDCNGFLLQCSLVLEMQPHMYPTERSKAAFIITQMSGKALLWAESLWSQNHSAAQSYSGFIDHFKEVFGKPSWDSSIGEDLCHLKQGKMSINEYALQFRTLAAKSGWNEQALLASYRQGLDPQVRLHLAAYEDTIGLERLIQLSIRVTTCMQSCLGEHQGQSSLTTILGWPDPVSPPEPAPEPMHLGSSHLTPAEWQRRLTQNLCLSCGAPGHAISACPIRPPHPMVSTIFPSTPKMKPLTTIGTLTAAHLSISVVALLDSGSAGNFISGALCRQLGLRTTATSTTYQIQSITRRPVSRRQATSIASPLETRSLEIPACYAPFSDVFCPKKASKLPPHRPWDCAIDLLPGEPVPRGRIYPLSILEEKAMEEYIKEALAQGYIRPSTSPAASSFFFMAKKDGGLRPCIDYRALNQITVKFRYPLPLIPAALEHLRGATVFTKLDLRSAYNLIRIREGDEWKTAFVTPTGHYQYLVMPYGLANTPSVFQDFIHEVLQEFLHRFVLVYIDDILIYSRNLVEHRHHVAEVLKCLREFQLLLKAERCSFHQPSVQFLGYNIDSSGIRMDEGKVAAIRNWPTPTTVKELQQEVFNTLKEAFTTAPLLVHPDPDRPFIVEVDAYTTGVGAVLSQQQGNPSRLHPCAFFSCKLNPAEINYDIGNCELLAVKLALKEWMHWLEGARHPFLVLTDHKNLEYLRAAKRLNPRQARWALFFTRFDFTISYRSGSKNTRADALSRLFAPEENPEVSETILPERGLPTAMEMAELLFNHIFRYFGIPEDIVSDRGPQFISRVWKAFFSRLGVAVSLSSGYHPQTNGQTERKIQEISRYLRTFCHGHQDSWSQYLGWAEYTQNSLYQPFTGLTPFQCVLGYQPPLFPWSGEPSNVPAVDYWFQESERVWHSVHHQLQCALRQRRQTADLRRSEAPVYQPGQKVWLSTRDIRLHQPCRKLGPRFIGPFTILKQINLVTYKLQLPPEYRIHSTYPFLSLTIPLFLPPQSLAVTQQTPPSHSYWTTELPTGSERFWTPGTMVVSSSIW
ncbi:hypothetical protein QTP86_027911 [Hemibagrus guttatus]|nr:hypothetical protein QTP86_027911 [Hemibagrus guttatus]